MVCKSCNREYTPLACPRCGNPLARDGICPACAVGTQVVCERCGQALEIAPVQPAADVGMQRETPPQGVQKQATQQTPQGQGQYPYPPAGPQYPPQFAQPGTGATPQYTAPPAGQGQYAPQGQFPQGYPGYPQPYAYFPAKVPLGGWFAFFYVITIIGAVFTGIVIISELVTIPAAVAIGYSYGAFELSNTLFGAAANIASLVLSIFIVVNIAKRNVRFKKFYHIRTVLVAAVALYSLAAMVINPEMAQMLTNASSYYSVNGVTTTFYLVPTIVSTLFTTGIAVAWWVYFERSRRVAYTCDPVNNPGVL